MKRFLLALILAALSCSTSNPSLVVQPNGVGGVGGTLNTTAGSAGLWTLAQAGLMLNVSDGGQAGQDAGTKPIEIITELPDGFTSTEIGGYRLGDPLDVGQSGAPSLPDDDCANVITGVSRDFRSDRPNNHPDFEVFAGKTVSSGMVAPNLGDDQKPVYTGVCEVGAQPTCLNGPQTTSQANFDQWYRSANGLNQPYLVRIWLAPQPSGLFSFESLFYYPLDGAGFKDTGLADDQKQHNFGFTTEIHTQFLYKGGEVFQFKGDDDVWIFINQKLAVDLGGLHHAQAATIRLDDAAPQLRIETGKVYSLDLFHAERHTNQSTFRIDSNLSFVNCGTVVPEPPPR